MIAVIETVTGSLSHEIFNAGMIWQIRKVYPEEEITYFCEKEQAEYVKKILDTQGCKGVTYETMNRIYLEFSRQEIAENKQEYRNIFRKCWKARFVVILTLSAVNSGLVKNIIRRFDNLKFGVCLHGEVEMILPQNENKLNRGVGGIKALKEYKIEHLKNKYFKDNLNEMAALPNCRVILYSDAYKRYRDDIEDALFDNISVLNLPYVFTYNKCMPEKGKVFRIGIMPSSAAAEDRNCIKIIEYLDSRKDKILYPYRFLIFNYHIGTYKNVGYITKHGRKRKDIEDFMRGCDWMLIPYDIRKYVLSSSGVMFDSIEAERPFFALDSNSFGKAIEAGCGIWESSIEALGERIIEQINSKNEGYAEWFQHVRRYKMLVEKENLERIERIFGK